MSKIKNMSRGGWIVIGVVAALMLIPTAAVAATASLVKIQGTSGNKADVTAANQLLTTEAKPTSYESYETGVNGVSSLACAAVTPALPSGSAYVMQNISVAVVDSAEAGAVALLAAAPTSANFCSTESGYTYVGEAVAPGGSEGTVDLPLTPGFVIPNGYQVYALALSLDADIATNGYLVPSSDAPPTPAGRVMGRLHLPQVVKG